MSRGRTAAVATTPGKRLGKRIASHWEFYLLLLPAIVITIIFKYIPIYGVQIAFRDYNPVQGFFRQPLGGMGMVRTVFQQLQQRPDDP